MDYLANNTKERKLYSWALLAIAILLTLPWLGLGHFYTRGEPREALVAVAMMEQGNYILPFFQGEIAFKPPMLHWIVALFSLPIGHVTEYTARMPSAVASIAMVMAFFAFYSKRTEPLKAFIASLLLITCFEVHRAAMTCRVDMVLMAFTAGAIIALFRWSERGYKKLPILASILASGAILTKGPIGAILPCFALCVYMLTTREKVCTIVIAMIKVAIIASIIPLIWYVAAYNQGGDTFLQLVLEENFGRFLGKMSYESHENGLFYYIPILLSGMLPWTLIAIFGLFTARYSMAFTKTDWWKSQWTKFRNLDKVKLYSWIVVVCIFIFYEIPKSKRSVYLLPMYPFMCLLLADYMVCLFNRKKRILTVFATTIAAIGIIYTISLFAIHGIDLEAFGSSRGIRKLAMQMAELQQMPINAYFIIISALPAILSIALLAKYRKGKAVLLMPIFIWITMLFALDGLINPSIKNGVPDYKFSQAVKSFVPDCRVYYYCPTRGIREEPIYTATFYLNDKVMPFHKGDAIPDSGYIMLKEHNLDKITAGFNDGYELTEVLRSDNEFTSFRGNMYLYKFTKTKNLK